MRIQIKSAQFLLAAMIAVLAAGCASKPVVCYVSMKPGEVILPNPIHTDSGSLAAHGPVTRIQIFPERELQELDGIGGAFNEIGAEAFAHLARGEQKELMRYLFNPISGAGFSLCRTAMGASDFAFDAYSYSETPEDYAQENFSILRDEKYLLPCIRAARAENPTLKLFASPWSPPGWMKLSGLMDKGVLNPTNNFLRDEPRVYQAYALYMAKYARAYAAAGAPLSRIVIQNETDMHTKYPSCWMQPERMAGFAKNYLKPVFEQENLDTQIWAGTFRTVELNHALEFVKIHGATNVVAGVSFQYAKSNFIAQVRAAAPGVSFMHSEGKCFNGSNSMSEAASRFEEVVGYFNAGLKNYCYWNMLLNETGKSGWDWRQNCLVTIDRKTGGVTYNPDYAPIYLFSKFIRPGSRRVEVNSPVTALAVKTADGVVLFVQNKSDSPQRYETVLGSKIIGFVLPSNCIGAIKLRYTHKL
jgi:glucosylceramidase